MKVIAEQDEGFKPVVLSVVCETQQEVNTLYNISQLDVTIPRAVGENGATAKVLLDSLFAVLQPLRTKE